MNDPTPSLRTFLYEEIKVGMIESREYMITPEVYAHSLAAFRDYNPVHVDEDFAKTRGFSGKVMHGFLLNGFISHFVGMHFPGRFSLLLSADLRYLKPSYLGDAILLTATVGQKMDVHNVIVMDATLLNTTQNQLAARARMQVMVKEQT